MSADGTLPHLFQIKSVPVKELLKFGEHLSVGDLEIDAQHQELFDLVIAICEDWQSGTSVDHLILATNQLAALLKLHFSYEEQLLAGIGYRAIDEHMAEHRQMLKSMATLADELLGIQSTGKAAKGSLIARGWPVAQLLIELVYTHVRASDMNYRQAIAASRPGFAT